MRRYLSPTIRLLAWIAFTAVAQAGAGGQAQGYRSDSTLKTATEVVNVYAVVRDREGHLVRDLQRTDFQLTEDSVPQDVRYFSQTTDAPLTLALAIDTTTCQDEALPVEKDAAKDFLRELLRPGDQALVLHFGSQVEILHGESTGPRLRNIPSALCKRARRGKFIAALTTCLTPSTWPRTS
ncbi:MAG: hypothetical protein DMG26_16100 [Acidobacteria bacterium]|nr:MAG: hypothetical protein DMG26_16100 [Acidobacteriota bacterium]